MQVKVVEKRGGDIMQIDRRVFLASIGSSAALAGCETTSWVGGPPSEPVTYEALVRQVKYDLGHYAEISAGDAEAPPLPNACAGQIALQIDKVKLTVTASVERTRTVTGGLKVPINLLTLEPSRSNARTLNNTLTTILTIWPRDERAMAGAVLAPDPAFDNTTPITDALVGIRRSLLAVSDTPPCFSFGADSAKDGNVVKWAFSLSRKDTAGGKAAIAIFSVGAEEVNTAAYANTIEVFFKSAFPGNPAVPGSTGAGSLQPM